MIVAALSMAAGIVGLYYGAEYLVGGAASMSRRWGLSPLVVGLTVVSFGTSMPELVTSLSAALTGRTDLALGNVVGSNVANIALILGCAALVTPLTVHLRVLRFDVPLLIVSTLLLPLFLRDGILGGYEATAYLVGLFLYIGIGLRTARSEDPEVQAEFLEGVPEVHRTVAGDVLRVFGGLVGLVLGANFLVEGAVILAAALGMSQTLIGLTVVALGTSLPELATSMVAAHKGEGDIAVGNVVGSNLFNLYAILGISGLVVPLTAGDLGRLDMVVLVGLTVLLLPLMGNFRIARWEGGVLVACYAGYMGALLV